MPTIEERIESARHRILYSRFAESDHLRNDHGEFAKKDLIQNDESSVDRPISESSEKKDMKMSQSTKSGKSITCALTGTSFEGRGKNHPALRSVLDDAFKNGTRDAVVTAIQEAKEDGVSSIEDFVDVARKAESEEKENQRLAKTEKTDSESNRRAESRKRDELNRKLRRTGYRWSLGGDYGAEMFREDQSTKEWVLRDPQGNVVSLDEAKKTIK